MNLDIKCDICYEKFTTQNEHEMHMKKHAENPNFRDATILLLLMRFFQVPRKFNISGLNFQLFISKLNFNYKIKMKVNLVKQNYSIIFLCLKLEMLFPNWWSILSTNLMEVPWNTFRNKRFHYFLPQNGNIYFFTAQSHMIFLFLCTI